MSGPLDVLKLAKLLPKVSRLDMNHKDVARRIPELTEAANLLAQGKITPKQYDEIVRQFKPVTPYDFVPQPATPQDAARALDKNKRQMFGRSSNIQSGETTDLRLDIPAYQNHGVWVNSIHRKGQPTVYGSTSVVKNPTMHGAPEKAFRVATGEAQKGPWAVIRGEWDPLNEDEAVKKAIASFGDPDWRQAGYDPERHGYFYDRETMEPVLAGEEAIQIGPLVLVRKPKYGEKDTEKYAAGGRVNMSRNTDAEIKSIIAASKRATERPRSDAVTRAKPETELQKSFDEYRMAQQEARERLLSELPSRAVSGAIPGAVGALSGYGAQVVGGLLGDLPELYQTYKPESFGNLPAGVQALPTTEDIQDLLREYINDSPEFSAGMTGGNAVALGQLAFALPGMVKGVAKGTPKVLGNLIDEILAPRSGPSGQRGSVGVRGKVPPGELAHKLAQERAALPVEQGGLGLPKNNTSEQRAEAMGFTGEGYHGSLYDIKKFNPNKASTEGFAARGTYITDSPEDASLNYADIFGPDVKGKVERGMELLADDRNSIARIGRRFQDEVLTPRQQEILLANTTDADNLGVVYPLRYRADKPIHLDRPQEKEVNLGPFERYDEAEDMYVDTPHTDKFNQALQEFDYYGGETNPIREFASEYGDEGVTADALYRAVQKEAAKGFLEDRDTGEMISSGVAAGDFLKHFGIDEIAHTPDFRNQQLNIGTKHTVAMNPDNIRSRFAAFDPFRKSAAIAAAMGVAAPDLMAKEKKRGGAVSQDVMNMAVMNQKVQKRSVGGGVKGVKALMSAAEEAIRLKAAIAPAYSSKIMDSTTARFIDKIAKENPKFTNEEVIKKASIQAKKKLDWERVNKPELEKRYGKLAKSSYAESNPAKMQNTPEVVEERIRKANEFLNIPTESWVPPKKDLQAFDRFLIKDAVEGFPGVSQSSFPRDVPNRASTEHVEELYSNPINRDLIERQIKRGLPLGGETFYASLYPVKQAALEAGVAPDKFEKWVHGLAPASARNSILNENAVGQFLRDMNARGIPLTEENVAVEMAKFKEKYGMGLPLMPIHRQGVANIVEGGMNLRDMSLANIPTNYKIPTYGTQKAGDFAKSVVLDVHEAGGQSQGSRYHPYLNEQGGFGNTEYGAGEAGLMSIANDIGIPGGMAQAGRWLGGGELTGLRSPRGDALDILERQIAYTLKAQGKQPNPTMIRNELLKQIDTGEGILLPWYKKESIPDVREIGLQRKKGGVVQKKADGGLTSDDLVLEERML